MKCLVVDGYEGDFLKAVIGATGDHHSSQRFSRNK